MADAVLLSPMFGLQIVGAPFAESTVLVLAHAYEYETEWHKRHPRLSPCG